MIQKKMKDFDRVGTATRKGKLKARQQEDPTKFLTPALIRKHINNKKPLLLKYGDSGAKKIVKYKEFKAGLVWGMGWIEFELDDLVMFDAALSRTEKVRASDAGAPVAQILGLSSPDRIKRANRDIMSAMLHRINGNELRFQVTAGKASKHTHHQVVIRLEEWEDYLKKPRIKNYTLAAGKAAVGRVSLDCTCEDHQYRYRYLIGRYNASLKPIERDFPKITNPRLKGFTCKHVIKALTALSSPSVHVRLGKEMQRQAEAGGLSGAKKPVVLTEQDQKKLATGGKRILLKNIRKEFADFKRAQKALNLKLKRKGARVEPKHEEVLRSEAKARAAKQKFELKRANDKAKRLELDLMKTKLESHLLAAIYRDKKPRDVAVREFAAAQGMPVTDAETLAKDIQI